MANLEIEGRIIRKLPVQSGQGARGAWSRQDFVLEYQDGNFPAQACFTAWSEDKVRDLERFQVGDPVKVSFNVRAREYGGRWYNDLRVWKLGAPGAAAPAAPAAAPEAPAYGASAAPASYAPAPTLDDLPADFVDENGNEDLPF